MRILIADDHPIVRRGLRQTLAQEFRDAVFAEVQNAQEALQAVQQERWDAIVLDVSMPGGSGLDVLKELKRRRLKTPVLVLSIHPESQYAVRALKSGASGYLTKQSATEELALAVRKIVLGGKYISPAVAERLATDLDVDPDEPAHDTLSDRELQVMCLIASGRTLSQIAEELALSPRTVSTYRSRVLEKMRMKTNAEIVAYAVRGGLV
jgi:two-component system invasion response regulator UvrY